MARTDTSGQRVYWCRWGTQSAMVHARTRTNAILRVRYQAFERELTTAQVVARPLRVTGPVLARLATKADRTRWQEVTTQSPTKEVPDERRATGDRGMFV